MDRVEEAVVDTAWVFEGVTVRDAEGAGEAPLMVTLAKRVVPVELVAPTPVKAPQKLGALFTTAGAGTENAPFEPVGIVMIDNELHLNASVLFPDTEYSRYADFIPVAEDKRPVKLMLKFVHPRVETQNM